MNLAEYKKAARKPHKYRAKRCVVDGIRFDSKREAGRYLELKTLEKAGKIERLKLQPEFKLIAHDGSPFGVTVGKYRADFQYFDVCAGRTVIEDAKGVRTETYKLKKRIVEAVHKIKITEV